MSDTATHGAAGALRIPRLSETLVSAREALFENPTDTACQDRFIDAAKALRQDEIATGVQQPLGSSYPRTSNKSFSHSEIAAALFYGVLVFGRDKIDWARLSTDAFRPASGGVPQWATSSSEAAEVHAGSASSVEPWRKAQISQVDAGYVARFDTNLAIPIQSYGSSGTKVAHPTIPGCKVEIDAHGFPVFEADVEVMMPYKSFGLSDRAQFKSCNKAIAARTKQDPTFAATLDPALRAFYSNAIKKNAPVGWVWHHHQDAGRMQLVRTQDHDAVVKWRVKHTGGAAIWCADFRHRPKDATSGRSRRHIYKTLLTMSKRDRKKAR